MQCPNCGDDTRVIDSRPDDESVARRRECVACKYRFNTIEIETELLEKLTDLRRNRE